MQQQSKKSNAPKVRDILTSIGEVVYDWQASGDKLRWSANAFDVMQTDVVADFPTGDAFADHITPDTKGARYRAIFASGRTDDGAGVGYECIYCLAPNGLAADARLWVEEIGRWFAGSDGRTERIQGVMRVVNDRQNREQRQRFLSQFDDLTGLQNRSAFFDQLQQVLDRRDNSSLTACYLVAHIDNFRVVNEAYGFDVADQVIGEVARRISHRLRDGDLVGRISGTKFGLLINNCSEKEMAATAERFLQATREDLIGTDAGPVHVTLSMGGVHLGPAIKTLRMAEVCALDALDQAKHYHRGSFRAFSVVPFALEEREKRSKMADQVIAALNERRIELAFQPIIDGTTGQADYHEGLLRVDDSEGNALPAALFVDYAEQLGLSGMLDYRVLELTLDLLFSHKHARMSINVSPDVCMDQDWLAYLEARIGSHRDVASRLVVELNERAMIRNLDVASAFVRSLKGLGARVALDDFGGGNMSLHALQALDVDMVKIDGRFVQDMDVNPQHRTFVRIFVDLARELGLEVIAKWVEKPETAEMLKDMDVRYLQGYHFGAADKSVPWALQDSLSAAAAS